MTQIDQGTIQYRDEVVRKTIHLFSLSIPIFYYYVTKQLALSILFPLTILSLVLDIGRYFYPKLGKLFYFIFGFMLREHEMDHKKRNLNGATYVLLSALICVVILPKVFFLTGFSVLILSDSSAALIGRKFGRHKFLFKSLEGTLAFFVSACLVVLFAPKIAHLPAEYIIGFVAVAIGAIAENVSYGWADDNLTIPLSIGLSMWILYAIFLPHLNLVLPNAPI
ncbi:MAG TPA: SEC59/DGK1/VTE5 family protein [Ignavibacteriales bacterium]|nr:SEC59/DGK1/VTE5 family protein [Ignavibacteriales bacterium]